MTLAEMMLILARLMCDSLVKAKLETKIDMVNPIPPKIPADNNIPLLMFDEISAIFNFSAMILKENIPNGLPIKSPKKTPIESGVKASFRMRVSMGIAVFAAANKGNIKNETMPDSLCSI